MHEHWFTVLAGLDRAARRVPGKAAVIVGEQERTYAELQERSNRLAASLRAAGIGKGARVAILTGNRIEFAEVYFGVLRAGATLVVLNARLTGAELSVLIRKAGASWLFFAHELQAAVDALDPAVREGLTRVTIGGLAMADMRTLDMLLQGPASGDPDVCVEEADEACILFTSGTTGVPKGVVLTHRNVFYQAINHLVEWDVRSDDVEVYPAPLYHGGGLATLPRTVLAGSTLVLMPSFDAGAFLALVARWQATRAVLVPTMCSRILELPPAALAQAASLRLAVTGGGIMPFELKQRMIEKFPGLGVSDSYGQTESTGSIACLKAGDALRKPASVGRAFFLNEIRLVDEVDADVATGQVGEIVVTGPTVMKGYHGEAEATAETLRSGWLHTGDLGRQDEEGFLYIVGRKKDMIISGGVNIYPREIEDVLCQHPAVLEAAVIGVPDPEWGETVKALVVPKPGTQPDADELIAFCRERLAGYKKPRSVEIVDEFPKNSLGKILKANLRRSYGSVFDPSG